MENRYRVILSGQGIYKEAELTPEIEKLNIGTEQDCEVRLRKELFFESVVLSFRKNSEKWCVGCSDNLYLSTGASDVRKLMTSELVHGTNLEVKYQESDNLLFRIEFRLDFDNEKRKYERLINISDHSTIRIGSDSGSDIFLRSEYAKNEVVNLMRVREGMMLQIVQTVYGVYHDGKMAEMQELIRNGDFFSVADYFFYYKNGRLWTEARNDMILRALNFRDHIIENEYPRFKRNTRIRTTISDESIEILDPSEKPQKPKENLFMRLFPSIGMLIASGAMAFMGGAMIIFSGISAGMAIITALLGVREGRKEYEEGVASRIETYNRYIVTKKQEIEQCRTIEWQALNEIYIPQEKEKQRLEAFSPDLFDRIPEDRDFLCIRLGEGAVAAKRKIDYQKKEKLETEDELGLLPQQIAEIYRNIPNAPVVCNLKEINAVGITGEESNRFEIFKNIILDITTRHYPTDVRLFFIAEKEHKERVHWLRFLPGVYCDTLQTRGIVSDDESKTLIFEYLYKELSARKETKINRPHLLLFFYDEYGFKEHPISKYTNEAKELGVTFLFFGENRGEIPLGCDYIIEISDSQRGALTNVYEKSDSTAFIYPKISDAQMERAVEIMTPVYTEEVSLESALTKSYSMFEMLNIFSVEDIDLEKRWKTSQVYKSMAAPIGISKTGMISLDLHDKAHGPHGLVAGTTGSGKSEILQTYILAMATLYHPYEVAFVIIDFKGGGMVNQFSELPHLLGAITNIDGKAINRSLKSIKAELEKRQRLFAEADVNHIDKYIRKYKENQVKEPLPHLIIIVDEFAELKAEQPEFMKELISAARIGRSLGVHLILATQKPAGQVNEQIWSNSRFKLCLKVQSAEDSNEVLKSPLAAEIKEPGRAYLQVGNNEIFELFQSAYSGVPERTDDSSVREFAIYSVPDSGKKKPIFIQKKIKSDKNNRTQLDALVAYIAKYCKEIQMKRLPDICLPPLAEKIEFCIEKKKGSGFYADIGIYDDPDRQYQGVYSVDTTSNNIMIIGSAQTGKTNLLQNIIRSLSENYTPDEVNIYIIDFASMILKNFEKLNHVGGVVCASEDEKLKNLFKLLRDEIEQRKEKFISAGVSSAAAYRETGKKDLPQIILLIDNLTALKELYFQEDDELLNICREGLAAGISIVIANAQTAGIGYKYLSNFSVRIATFCNDTNEYSSLYEHCRERLDNIPGRCLVEVEKQHLECQSYLAFEGEKEFERANEIRRYIEERNLACGSKKAERIPLIPAILNISFIKEQFGQMMQKRFQIVAGLDYETVQPFYLDLSSAGVLAISGRAGCGRHNCVKYILEMLNLMYPEQAEIYIIDSIEKKLSELKENALGYSMLAEDGVVYITEIEEKLKERYALLANDDIAVLENEKLLVLVLDNLDAVTAICNDRNSLEAYKNITGRYKNLNVCIIVSCVENAPIPYSSPEILKDIRDRHQMLYFDDMANMKVYDLPLMITRKFKKAIETGDGYYIKDNECIKLKTPLGS